MTTFVCLHGAGGRASWWRFVAAHLEPFGHDVVAVDLPCEEEVGLEAYVDAVLVALEGVHGPVVLVAHSLSGLVAPLVATRTPVEQIVLVAAMVPRPGESGGEWWGSVGHEEALAAQGVTEPSDDLFVHDVPAAVLAVIDPPRDQTSTLFEEPWPLAGWPAVPTTFLLCRDDRFFPAAWLRDLVRDRLGIEPVEVPGGHAALLSQPEALASALARVVAHPGLVPAGAVPAPGLR